MRVAHLTTVDSSLRYLLVRQLEAVLDQGGEVVGISAPGPDVPWLEEHGIRHVALPSSTRSMSVRADVRAARELWRVLRTERPDVLHTHNPKPGLYGRVLGRLAGVPIVVNTVHGLYATPDDPLPKRLLVYLAEAVASRFSHAELVQSAEDLELMRRWRLTPRRRVRHLGNGVDLERFDPTRFSADERQQQRTALGAGPDDVVVGMVGRLVAEKGYPELFEALDRLPERYRLVVVGPRDTSKPDALPPSLLEDVGRRGVRFLGMRDDVDRLYAAMDIFVLPSHREGFPRSAMEASAMGLPVVTTDVRGCREAVDQGVNGLLVPVRDPVAIAAALSRLGDDVELRRAMGDAGRRIAAERFDERRVAAAVMSTYAEVAARKRRIPPPGN